MFLRRKIPDFVFYLILSILAVLFFLPLLWLISSSFKPEGGVMTYPPKWIPEQVTFSNYPEAIRSAVYPIGVAFFNSTFLTIIVVIVTLTLDSMAAYAFAKLDFYGRDFIFLLVLGTLIVPFETLLTPLFLIMYKLKLINSYLGIILPAFSDGFGIFLLRQFFLTIPKDLIDAARMDGCSHFRIYWKIVLPLAKPAMSTLALFTFLGNWNSYTWPLIIISKPQYMTLPLALANLSSQTHYTKYGIVSAACIISILPVFIIFLIAQKYIVEGITLSALKG